MLRISRFFPAILLLYCVACNNVDGTPVTGTYSVNLVSDTTITFPLDTTQSFYFKYIQYDEDQDKLYIFNSFNSSIYFYDYTSKAFEKKITLEQEGPDGVGPTYRMGFYVRKDTIYLLNYKTSKLITMAAGKVINKIDLSPKVFEEEGLPEATVFNPILLDGGKLQIITQSVDPREDNTRLSNLVLFDTKTDSVQRVIRRPELYNAGYWGMFNLYRVSHAVNAERSENVFCFPASPELFVYNGQNELVAKKEINSDLFENDDIRPIDGVAAKDGLNYLNYKRESAQKHDLTTSHFGPIYFDKFRKVYYVFTNIGLTKSEYNDPDKFNKYPLKHSVIVLDEELKKLTEYLLPRNVFFVGGVVITKDGLLISNSKEYNLNEDALPFTIFKLQKQQP
jgi:hypothetical protein